MKKKLFFKLFIFAVIGTLVTFTSCKDYDDDIDSLNADVSTVKSQLTTLDADVSSAQTAAANALAKANEALAAAQAAGDAEAIAALETEVAGIQAKLTELSGLKEEVTTLMAALTDANEAQLEDIKAQVQELSDQLLAMVGGMVTDVELLYSITAQGEDAFDLNLSTVMEKDNVFEEGISNAITFKKGTQIQKPASFVIRVSPTNAEITPEMINLLTSKGDIYENLEVVSVEPYDKLLTASVRSTNGAGLWEVKVQLKNYDKDEFEAATQTEDGKILFAVAVDNTKTAENPMIRKVVSTYDLTLTANADFTGAAKLDFKVNEKPVAQIKNRNIYDEQEWDGETPYVATDEHTTDGDDRSSLSYVYPAVQGQPLTIELQDPTNLIRAMYVTLDYKENTDYPSEWNAWNSYSYTGLGTVVEGTKTQITINSSAAISDEIGFRVFAVNYDGTLVDPDGKAFYVSLGQEGTSWNAVNTVVTATDKTASNATNTPDVNVTLTKLTGADSFDWTTDKSENGVDPAFHVYFENAAGTVIFDTDPLTSTTIPTDFSLVKTVYAKATQTSWLNYKDDKVYNGKLSIKNSTGHVLATLNVTFKKVLPTSAPSGFSVKSGQLTNGIYNCYLIPNDWTAPNATEGKMPLAQVFNYGEGTPANYKITFAASKYDNSTPPKVIEATFAGNEDLSVNRAFIDNTTQHATTVAYDFGLISTETKNSGGTVIEYKVTVTEFPTVYSNIYNSTYSWNWTSREQLTAWSGDNIDYTAKDNNGNYINALPYSTEITYGDTKTFNLGYIYGKSSRDGIYNAYLDVPYKKSLLVKTVKLVSNVNNEEEYFVATYPLNSNNDQFQLKPKEGSLTNPQADVPSTLVITAQDMYGNDVVIRLPMTVKPR